MQMAFKIIVLITLSLLGGLVYSLTANIFVMANMIPADTASNNFGYEMTQKAVFVWMGAIALGVVSLFIKKKWRYILLFCPLIAPSLFAFLYTLSSQ